MKIYIDFDGTLFNTDKYISDFMNIFYKYGINNDVFNASRVKLFSDDRLFDINIMVDYFINEYNIDIGLKNNINNLFNDSYVYDEVSSCLTELINCGFELYLLTYGNENYQKDKIIASNLSGFFKDIIITMKDKSELNVDYKNSIFIDNNPIVIENLYNAMAKIIIRIKRDSDRYSKDQCRVSGVIECNDFNQIVKFLKGGLRDE